VYVIGSPRCTVAEFAVLTMETSGPGAEELLLAGQDMFVVTVLWLLAEFGSPRSLETVAVLLITSSMQFGTVGRTLKTREMDFVTPGAIEPKLH